MKKSHELPEWKEMMKLFIEYKDAEYEFTQANKKRKALQERYDDAVIKYFNALAGQRNER